MAIGDLRDGHVPSNAPGPGPQDASGAVGKHVAGSGDHPGTGPACTAPSAQSAGNTHQGLS
jgi:hypothetical protein